MSEEITEDERIYNEERRVRSCWVEDGVGGVVPEEAANDCDIHRRVATTQVDQAVVGGCLSVRNEVGRGDIGPRAVTAEVGGPVRTRVVGDRCVGEWVLSTTICAERTGGGGQGAVGDVRVRAGQATGVEEIERVVPTRRWDDSVASHKRLQLFVAEESRTFARAVPGKVVVGGGVRGSNEVDRTTVIINSLVLDVDALNSGEAATCVTDVNCTTASTIRLTTKLGALNCVLTSCRVRVS